MRRARSWIAVAALTLGSFAICTMARADEASDLFADGVKALAAEDAKGAIDDFEAVADRGVVDAASSFDRGLAYAARVRLHAEVPGDLGQAVHGFEEARDLTRDPKLREASRQALGMLREEIARRRARAGDPALVDPGVPLGRAVVDVASEDTWSALAFVSAWALAIALGARVVAKARRAQVAATVALIVTGALTAATAILSLAARDERLHLREAVVVSPSARPADERHLPLAGAAPVPEGARVQTYEESQGFTHVRWAQLDAYVPTSSLRPLARRE